MRHKLTRQNLTPAEEKLLQVDTNGYDFRCRLCFHLFKAHEVLSGICPICDTELFLTSNLGVDGLCA